jgi:hypothetical protein
MLLYSTAETSGSEVLLKTKKLAYIPDSSDEGLSTPPSKSTTESRQMNSYLSQQNQLM